jgi:two-component system, NarL family, nitrate/nitrite response regulator NarL
MTYKPQLHDDERTDPARVYVWTDDALAADALRHALAAASQVLCVDDLSEADVLLWDAGSMPLHEPRVLTQLKAAQASDRYIVALVPDAAAAALCVSLGARAALLRRIHAPSLSAAISAVRAGLCVYDAEFAETWLPAPMPAATEPRGASALTSREREVLELLALGLSNAHIAKRLEVSVHTVKFHVNSILAKLSVSTRTAAVSAAVRAGLITL